MSTKKSKQKVIVIGLDGASSEIFFDIWKDELPNINSIKNKGFYGTLKSSDPPITGPAWASFATGCNPGKHGIYDFLYLDKNTNNLRPVDSRNIKVQTVYEILRYHGKKSILINLPVSYPPKTEDIFLTSLLTKGDEFIFPKQLKKEIPELKKYRLVPDSKFYVEFEKEKFIEDISNLERDKFEIAKKLFEKEWDLFFTLFSGTDWLQHKFYYQMIKKKKNKNTLIINFYKELDSYIGWFLKNKDENTHLFILSDHGFKLYDGLVGVNNLLEKYGYLKFKKSDEIEAYKGRRQKEISQTLMKKRALSVNPIIGKLLTKNRFFLEALNWIYKSFFGKKIKILTTPQKKAIDFELSKAYCLTSGLLGIVVQREHENIKRELLKKLDDEEIFTEIKEKSEVYNGPYLEDAPDIILKSKKYLLMKDQFHTIINKNANGHDYFGIFLLDSPYIKQKQSMNREIIDIAPTILNILGIDYQKYNFDGKIIL